MYRLLKVNTISAYPIVCWIEDAVNPRTGKTGLSPIISFSKNGAGFSAGHVNSGAMAEVGLGWYKYTPDTVDTNTQGVLIMNIASGTADIPKIKDDIYFVDANYGEDEFSTRIAALSTLSKLDAANAMKDQDVHLTALSTGSVAKLLDDDIADVPASTWNVPYDNQIWATKAWANVIENATTLIPSKTQVDELWQMAGLDADNPVTYEDGSTVSGDIELDNAETLTGGATVTRKTP